jgi:hypothetical protein
MTRKLKATDGELSGNKGLVDDFLFLQGRGREHHDHEEDDHSSTLDGNGRTHFAS